MRVTVLGRHFRLAGFTFVALGLTGCGGPDIVAQGSGSDGGVWHAEAYRVGGSFYAINLKVTVSQRGRLVVTIIDKNVAGADGLLAMAETNVIRGADAYLSLTSRLSTSTQAVVNLAETSDTPGAGNRPLGSAAFGPTAWEYWAQESGAYTFTMIGAGVLLVFGFGLFVRRKRSSLLSSQTYGPSVTKEELNKLQTQIDTCAEGVQTALKRCSSLDAKIGKAKRSEAPVAVPTQKLAAAEALLDRVVHEIDAMKAERLSDAQTLDSWVRNGRLPQEMGLSDIESLRAGALLCRLANDLLTASAPTIDRITMPGVSLEWVTLKRVGEGGSFEISRSNKPGPWLSFIVQQDRTRMIVPASKKLDSDDIGLLQTLFRGSDSATAESIETLRIVKPAVLVSNKKSNLRRVISDKGRILVGDSQLQASEYLILAMENTLIAVAGAATHASIGSAVSAAPEMKPKAEPNVRPKAEPEVSPTPAAQKEIEAPPLPRDMPDLWWQPALEQATVDGGTQPEDYVLRVVLASEHIAKALDKAGAGWVQKLAWIRFDFDDDCLKVFELRTTEAGLTPVGVRQAAPLRGRDLYQVAVFVAHPGEQRALVFVPLGEFLLDNHVTVFSRLLRNPPFAPAYVKRIVRPAIVEKIKGKDYRVVSGGEMGVELKVDE